MIRHFSPGALSPHLCTRLSVTTEWRWGKSKGRLYNKLKATPYHTIACPDSPSLPWSVSQRSPCATLLHIYTHGFPSDPEAQHISSRGCTAKLHAQHAFASASNAQLPDGACWAWQQLGTFCHTKICMSKPLHFKLIISLFLF